MRWFVMACLWCNLTAHAETPGPEQILQEWDADVLAPAYQQLANEAAALTQQTQNVCRAPSKQKLNRLKAPWLKTTLRWRRLELLPAGPTLQSRASRSMDFRPVRENLLLAALAGEEANHDSAALGGLSTLEWILYPTGTAQTLDARQRCDLLLPATKQLRLLTAQLATAWALESQKVQAMGQLSSEWADRLNLLLASLTQLEKQLKKSGPSGLPGTPSHSVRQQLLAQFEGLLLIWQGPTARKTGFSRLLDIKDHPVVDRQIRELIETLITQARVTPEHQLANALSKPLAELQGRLEKDTAEALQIGIGFNDADGD